MQAPIRKVVYKIIFPFVALLTIGKSGLTSWLSSLTDKGTVPVMWLALPMYWGSFVSSTNPSNFYQQLWHILTSIIFPVESKYPFGKPECHDSESGQFVLDVTR
jgi:hypothetical protein